MASYASWTGTHRNRDALQAHGWRLLMSPDTWDRSGRDAPHWTDGSPAPYALDNGAWGCFQAGIPWDADRFLRVLDSIGKGADWTVLPDIVGGGLKSLELSLSWVERIPGRLLLPVQNGMTPDHVRPHLSERVGIFVGGDTDWKVKTLAQWARLARAAGAWCHVGRVNTVRRIAMCGTAGVHSFDGTSVTRFAVNIDHLDAARKAHTLFHREGPWMLAA